MQETVQYQILAFEGKFSPGDVILSNHPLAGGSHLPDLTVITPVFYKYVYIFCIYLKKLLLLNIIYKYMNIVLIVDMIF